FRSVASLRLDCAAVEGVTAGAAAHVSIRPERLICAENPIADAHIAGTVVENIFVGTDVTSVVKAGDLELRVRTSNSDRGSKRIFERGADVVVNVEPGAARMLVD
ncbi:MAG: TOBE domain-containing protein, partial [Pseudomonadota bacterium]